MTGYGEVAMQMRQAAKRILYATSQSNAMNGISAGTRLKKITPAWQIAVIVGTIASAALFAFSTAAFVYAEISNNKKK